MSDLEMLHEILDTLPPRQIRALLTLLRELQPVSEAEFGRRLAEVPDEEVDEETTARILVSEAEEGESVSHEVMKKRLSA